MASITQFAWTTGALALGAVVGAAAASGRPLAVLGAIALAASVVVAMRADVLLFTLTIVATVIAGVGYSVGMRNADYLAYALMAVLAIVAIIERLQVVPAPLAEASAAPHLALLVTFGALGTLVTLAQFHSLVGLVAGVRSYLLGIALACAFAAIRWRPETLRQLGLVLMGIGFAQAPVALFQYVVLRGRRLASGGLQMGDSATEASDSVVGTWGGDPFGGGFAGHLALGQCVLLAAVLALVLARALPGRRAALAALVLAVPLILSENKVVFLALPIVFLVVAGGLWRRHPLAFIAGAASLAFGLAVTLWVYYLAHWSNEFPDFVTALNAMIEYNVQPTSFERLDRGEMGRLHAIQYWWTHQHLGAIPHLVFGHGFGASAGGGQWVHAPLVAEHYGLRINRNALAAMLWDTGLAGALLIGAALVAAFLSAGRAGASPLLAPFERAFVKAAQVAVVLGALDMLLHYSLLAVGQAAFAFFLPLGVIAFYRTEVREREARALLGGRGIR